MSTQLRSDLKSTAPNSISRNAMNPFGAMDLTALAVTLSPVGRATPLAADAIEAAITAGDLNALASALKAVGLRSQTAPRGKAPRTSEGRLGDLANVETLTAALRGARERSEIASRARHSLLARAHRDLREPLTAMLRLNSDWNALATDMIAVRIIEQQRQALEVMGDLIDSFLTIGEPEMARQPARLTGLTSRSAVTNLGEANAAPEPCSDEWSADWARMSAVGRPEVPIAVGPASRARRVLLIDEDRVVLGALRIYLLCAGYQVFAAANADEALDRARMATPLIDIMVANVDLTGDDDGLAVIDKTRLLLGYSVPAVLLTTETSTEIGKRAHVTDVFLLRNPVNPAELNALIGEVLKRPRRSRLAHLRTTDVKLGHDQPNPEVIC